MMLFKLAWRNIWRNKRRTFITMASIFFAVVLSVAMKGLKEGSYNKMMENILGAHSGYIQVQQKDYWNEKTVDNSFTNNEDLISKIKSISGVTSIVPRLQTGTPVINDDNVFKMCALVGIDPDAEQTFSKIHNRVLEGSYLDKNDKGVLIGKKLAEILNLKVGDEITFTSGQGYHGDMIHAIYKIKGIFSMGSPEFNERLIYIPIKELRTLLGMKHLITSYQISIKYPDLAPQIAAEINTLLSNSELVTLDWEEMHPELKSLIEGDRGEGVIIMSILYMVITFGIFGTLIMMLAERMREIGILIAIGTKRWSLAFIVLIELMMMSILGVLAGGAVSYPVLLYLHFEPIKFTGEYAKIYEDMGFEPVLQASIDPFIIINQVIIIAFIVALLSFYPFFKISRVKAIEAIRS